MRQSGRVSAAIEILSDFETRRVPLKTAIADWGRNNRYAGAKDRAWISGICLDVLRRRQSLSMIMADDSPRAAVLGGLAFLWQMPLAKLQELAAEEPHGAGALTQTEKANLDQDRDKVEWQLDVPDFVVPMLERAFGSVVTDEASAMAKRADVDLRINTLKATSEKALQALKSVRGTPVPALTNAARITAPDPSEKAPAVTVIPAFNKGWLEVQDLGSQLAAACAGDIKGKQVLDFCAGGGGKTLALAAMMENTGQLHAYDIDARRLKPLYARAKRAGLRNLQIMPPQQRSETTGETLAALTDKMDVVFVDAPCTGAGTWRRHPDTKWRLTEKQLQRRQEEQLRVLQEARHFVKQGGTLIYVTCSVFKEENEDQLEVFLKGNTDFVVVPVMQGLRASNLLTPEGEALLAPCLTEQQALRLSPNRCGTDGFFVSTLAKK